MIDKLIVKTRISTDIESFYNDVYLNNKVIAITFLKIDKSGQVYEDFLNNFIKIK